MFVWLLGENFGTVYPTGEVFIQQTLLNYNSTHIAMCEWMIFKKYKFIYFGLTQFALSIGWHFFVFTYWRPWVLCTAVCRAQEDRWIFSHQDLATKKRWVVIDRAVLYCSLSYFLIY